MAGGGWGSVLLRGHGKIPNGVPASVDIVIFDFLEYFVSRKGRMEGACWKGSGCDGQFGPPPPCHSL